MIGLIAGAYKFLIPLTGATLAVGERMSESTPVQAVVVGGLVAASLTSMGVALSKSVRAIRSAYDYVKDFIDETRDRLSTLESRQTRIQERLGITDED